MQFKSKIIFNVELSPGYWRIRLTGPASILESHAGQFVMVRVGQGISPLLRRPLGIMETGEGPEGPFFDLLYHVVGNATEQLAALQKGGSLDVLGPLGQGFTHGTTPEDLLVGGGIGLPPLYCLAKELCAKGRTPHLFAGGRTAKDIVCIEDFERLGVVCHIATENGERGDAGRVTLPFLRYLDGLNQAATIYTCGPEGMLKAVAAIARERHITCQVSLENYMACGVGACLGCVTPGKDHSAEHPDYRCVCKEGPVFDIDALQWEGV